MQTACAENRADQKKGTPTTYFVSVSVEVHLTIDGEYRDADTGLIYLRARWYDPNIGRFITMDVYEGSIQEPKSLNKYGAFNGDPINQDDPSGYDSLPDVDRYQGPGLFRMIMRNVIGKLSIGGKKKIEIVLDSRKLSVFHENGDVAFTAAVVPGGPDTPTEVGSFALGDWEKDRTSKRWGKWSETPWSQSPIGANVFGAYFVFFLDKGNYVGGGQAIHGKFGKGIAIEKLYELFVPFSHGCVRLSNDDIIRLHDLIPNSRGTPVRIKKNMVEK